MKKIIFSTVVILTSVLVFSFKSAKIDNEITITVTADKQTSFDMNRDGEITKSLVTPYKMTINSNDSRFIFRAASKSPGFQVTATTKDSKLTADWQVTVLIVSNRSVYTFGMD